MRRRYPARAEDRCDRAVCLRRAGHLGGPGPAAPSAGAATGRFRGPGPYGSSRDPAV